ncbi:hypothetical protein HY620_00225 [Candidatus Uhrbacteria bacterium]|nr:hypothetical protein [Candidatus Uhrbacteria bacterium]
MTSQVVGLTLQTVGTLFIGFSALMVHHRVSTQAIIDTSVTKSMDIERKIGILGLALIFIGYLLQII